MADYKDYYEGTQFEYGRGTRDHIQQSPSWTPGTAPTSTTGGVPKWFPNTIPDPVPTYEPQKLPGASGWLCPACGQGNAPFVAQCGCGGRTGVSTTTNRITVTPTPAPEPEYQDHCDSCREPLNTGEGHEVHMVLKGEPSRRGLYLRLCDNCLDAADQE